MKFGKSRSAKYYSTHEAARKRKQAYDARFNKKPSQVKKRVELNAYNRKHKSTATDDASHKNGKIVGFLHRHKNRGSKVNSAGDRRARGGKRR